jgi:8-oxo-dGTP pyrophosphatase MutT (NUDIX family)
MSSAVHAFAEPSFTVADLRERIARVGDSVDELGDYGDHRWNPGHPRLQDIWKLKLRDAAVLIPVVDRPGGATLILTRRTDALRAHSGQVAFPGGRVDDTDPDAVFAALRETDEEIGIRPDEIEVVGQMPQYVAGSGFRISPVIGVVQPGYELDINEDEVAAVFEAPLSFLMRPENQTQGSREFEGRVWKYYDMPYDGQRIWGVTAGIIRAFYERFYA